MAIGFDCARLAGMGLPAENLTDVIGYAPLSDAVAAQICEHIANGGTIRNARRKVGCAHVPLTTLWEFLTATPARRSNYTRAREIRATRNAEKLERVTHKVETRALEPDAGRIVSANLQWLAERQDPAQWAGQSAAPQGAGLQVNIESVLVQLAQLDARTGLSSRLGVPALAGTATNSVAPATNSVALDLSDLI